MKRWVVIFFVFTYLFSSTSYQKITAAKQYENQWDQAYFTENKGQWDPQILFMGQTSKGRIAFAKDGIYYQVVKSFKKPLTKDECFETQTIKQTFLNTITLEIMGGEILPHYNNYFLGSDSSKWATSCRNFRKITYQNITQGVNLSYFFTPEGIEYEYSNQSTSTSKHLTFKTDFGNALNAQSKFDPLIYSTLLGSSHEDDFAYAITLDTLGNSYLGGETYSLDFPLTPGSYKTTNKGEGDGVIAKLDPTGTMLLYSTFLGGLGNDYVRSVTVDSTGNVYATGTTSSLDFPTTPGACQNKLKGSENAFIIKLNKAGSSLLYGTYLGGSKDDYGYGIAVDSSGSAYVTGTTGSLDFPVTSEVFHPKNKGAYDAFVSKLNSSGGLLYSVLIGGADFDYAKGIALDSSGSVYITGSTGSSDFPVSPGAYQNKLKGLGNTFILKLNQNGTAIIFSTFLGGSYYDYAYGLALDTAGNTYITGSTSSKDFPFSMGAYQSKSKGGNDAFVAKINSTGSSLLYSTYLGGSSEDSGSAIAVDAEGQAYVCGSTDSLNFPITQGSYQPIKRGEGDVFVSKLNSKGILVYSTYLGSSWDDDAYSLALDQENKVVVCGETKGSDFPVSKDAYWNNQSGESDIFVTKMNLAPQPLSDQTKTAIIELWIGYRIALLNGELEILDTVPLLVNNTTMVPIRFIAESFQATVFYQAKTQEVDIILGDSTITLWLSKPVAQIESIQKDDNKVRVVALDVSPFIQNGRTLVPVRFISEVFGAEVTWNSKDQKVTLSRKK